MRLLGTDFDPVTVAATLVLGTVAVGLVWVLRGVLLEAPGAAFPLILLVLFGPVGVWAFIVKRRE